MSENTTDTTEATEAPVKKTRKPRAAQAVELTPTQMVLSEVEAERRNQDARWGEQNHPIIGGFEDRTGLLRRNYAARATELKVLNKGRVAKDTMGFDSIILEEVYEALCESDPAKIREELVQAAATCVVAIEALDRAGEVAA